MKLFKNWLSAFDLDPRALGLARVLFCLLSLFQLFKLSNRIEDFFTSSGVAPLSLIRKTFELGDWSLLGVMELDLITYLVFALYFVSIVLALAGFKTRLALFFSWIIGHSIYMRNIFIFDHSFSILLALNLLLLFSNTHMNFSLDAGERLKKKSIPLTGIFVFVLIAYIYIYPSYIRYSGHWLEQSNFFKSYVITQLKPTFFGFITLQVESLHSLINFMIFWFEACIVFALFFTIGSLRNLLILIAIVYHLVLALLLGQYFSEFTLISLLICLFDFSTKYKAKFDFKRNTVVLFLTSIIVLGLANQFKLYQSPITKPLARVFGLDLEWKKFASLNYTRDWYRVLGNLKDKSQIDVMSKSKQDFFAEIFPHESSLYLDDRFYRNYLINTHDGSLKEDNYVKAMSFFLKTFCKDERLEIATLTKVVEDIKDNSRREKLLEKYYCRED